MSHVTYNGWRDATETRWSDLTPQSNQWLLYLALSLFSSLEWNPSGGSGRVRTRGQLTPLPLQTLMSVCIFKQPSEASFLCLPSQGRRESSFGWLITAFQISLIVVCWVPPRRPSHFFQCSCRAQRFQRLIVTLRLVHNKRHSLQDGLLFLHLCPTFMLAC